MARTDNLARLGRRLKDSRKRQFPNDGIRGFAVRVGVSPATLQKMEKGAATVALGSYYSAAEALGLEQQFEALFVQQTSLFDD